MRTPTVITAMAAPAEHHKSLLLYHGTTDEENFAQDILKCGYLQGRIVQGRAQQAPVAGYVYTSKDVMYAAGYAGVYTSWGLGCTQKRREGQEKFTGYVFVVDASAASDILVDEDVLGEIGTSRSNKYSVPDNLYHYLQRMAVQCATTNQLNKARNGEMAYQSAIGKKMQKAIPEQKMRELIDHCPHLALKSPEQRMPIVGYYTINKCVSTPEEFFANATYHEYKQANIAQAVSSVLRASLIPHIVVSVEDYTGNYNTAPDAESGAPLYNVCLNGIFPADLYSGRGHEYAYSQEDRESLSVVLRVHNKPGSPVTIYRAVPKDVKPARINKGDWVTLSRAYAKEHGESNVPGKFKILSMRAHARDLYTTGDLAEWGYYPREATEDETALLKRRRQLASINRLMSAANGASIILLNKYPNDEHYGKPAEFFREEAERRASEYNLSDEERKSASIGPAVQSATASDSIAFNIEVTGHHSGQTDLRLVASQAGQVVGTIDFVDYQGSISVSMIHVDPAFRRKGVGSAMLRRLQQEYPDADLDLGMLTGDGAALINAVPKTTTENPKVKELESELAEITEKLNSYEEAANQIRRGATEDERNAFYNKVADWNELSDRKEQIEDELVGIRRQFVRYV